MKSLVSASSNNASTIRFPKLRLHRPSGRAIVSLNGRDIYLGAFGSPEAKAEYDRLIAQWLTNGRRLPDAATDLTINELILAYVQFADRYYRKPDGTPTGEIEPVTRALKPLREMFGHALITEFGPIKLKTVRQRMIDEHRVRLQINAGVRRIIRCFKWGVENELVPGELLYSLKAVAGLRAGRTDARESEPVRPVAEIYIEAIRTDVTPQVWAMIELQRLTGMRPGEVTQMRTADIDRSAKVWVYRPQSHKTQHHGKNRTIYLGPKAQAVLSPWLKADQTAFLFSPREALAQRRADRSARRKTPLSCGNRPGTNRRRKPVKQPGERYTVQSYGHAIVDACRRATRNNVRRFMQEHVLAVAPDPIPATLIVPNWSPNQLRHAAATNLRREFGLEAAQIILGHAKADITQIYAERDEARAIDVMARVG